MTILKYQQQQHKILQPYYITDSSNTKPYDHIEYQQQQQKTVWPY
jgi:hypothetical protein